MMRRVSFGIPTFSRGRDSMWLRTHMQLSLFGGDLLNAPSDWRAQLRSALRRNLTRDMLLDHAAPSSTIGHNRRASLLKAMKTLRNALPRLKGSGQTCQTMRSHDLSTGVDTGFHQSRLSSGKGEKADFMIGFSSRKTVMNGR